MQFIVSNDGADTLVRVDMDGDGVRDMEIKLTGVIALTPDSFIL